MNSPSVFFIIVVFFLLLICMWRIVSKAGYSGAWSFLYVVPVVNAVAFFAFAFGRWPALLKLEDELRREKSNVESLKLRLKEMEVTRDEPNQAQHNNLSDEQDAYDLVSNELQTKTINNGLWLKAEVLANGNSEIQRLEYVKLRVSALISRQKQVTAYQRPPAIDSELPKKILYGTCTKCSSTVNLRSFNCINCGEEIDRSSE